MSIFDKYVDARVIIDNMVETIEYVGLETTGTYPFPDVKLVIADDVIEENLALRREVAKVKTKLAKLEKKILKEDIIILRDISKEQAKSEIRNLFQSGRTLYYSDIADGLCLDLELVVNVCNELLESKEIHIDDRAS